MLGCGGRGADQAQQDEAAPDRSLAMSRTLTCISGWA